MHACKCRASPEAEEKVAKAKAEAAAVAAAPGVQDMRVLIYGRSGWLGGLMGEICEKQGVPFTWVLAAGPRLDTSRTTAACLPKGPSLLACSPSLYLRAREHPTRQFIMCLAPPTTTTDDIVSWR